MSNVKGQPSKWLLNNSKGYPDFLFTILTISVIILLFVSLMWMTFGVLAFFNAGGAEKANVLLAIMDNIKTGLISLAGVVFGLAGSYTVRRYKYDDHYLEKKELDSQMTETPPVQPQAAHPPTESGLRLVVDEEDI